MAFGFKWFLKGIRLIPQNVTAPSEKGDLRVNSVSNKLELHDGSVVQQIATEAVVSGVAGNLSTHEGLTTTAHGIPGQIDAKITTHNVASAHNVTTILGSSESQNVSNKTISGDLKFKAGVTTDTVSIQAPATIPASYTLTVPTTPGTNGQVLKTDGSGVLSWTDISSVPTYVAGEDLVQGDALYISQGGGDGRTAQRVYKLDPNSDLRMSFVGFATSTKTTGNVVGVQIAGTITFSSYPAFVWGQPVYADPDVVGGIRQIVPSTVGEWVIPVGFALNDTDMIINTFGSSDAIYIDTLIP